MFIVTIVRLPPLSFGPFNLDVIPRKLHRQRYIFHHRIAFELFPHPFFIFPSSIVVRPSHRQLIFSVSKRLSIIISFTTLDSLTRPLLSSRHVTFSFALHDIFCSLPSSIIHQFADPSMSSLLRGVQPSHLGSGISCFRHQRIQYSPTLALKRSTTSDHTNIQLIGQPFLLSLLSPFSFWLSCHIIPLFPSFPSLSFDIQIFISSVVASFLLTSKALTTH